LPINTKTPYDERYAFTLVLKLSEYRVLT